MVSKKKASSSNGYSPTQWLAIIVVVIMVFSTIAFSLLSGNNPTPSDPLNPPPIDNQPTTPIRFVAQTTATVENILSSFKFFAPSSEVDIQLLDQQIQAISGITTLQSRFAQDPSTGNQLIYTADISFDEARTTREALVAEINARTVGKLSDPVVFPYAVIRLPTTLQFISQNQDLNLSREYVLVQPLRQGIVEQDTLVNDQLTVQVEATFSGSTPSDWGVYELANISATPLDRIGSRVFQVLSLEPRLVLYADANIVDGNALSRLEEQLKTIVDVNAVILESLPRQPVRLEVNEDINLSKLQSFLETIYSVVSVETISSQRPFVFELSFASIGDYTNTQPLLADYWARENISLEQVRFDPLSVSVRTTISLTEAGRLDSNRIAERVLSYSQGVLGVAKIYQSGFFQVNELAESITDPTSPTYPVPDGKIAGLILPGVQENDDAMVSIEYQITRQRITAAFGTQTERLIPA